MNQRGFRNRLVAIHRYVSLALLVFWFLQILSGLALVYARTLDDLTMDGAAGEVNARLIDDVVDDLSGAGVRVEQYFISGGIPGRVDLLGVDRNGARKLWRVDGAGHVLRVSAWSEPFGDVAVARLVLLFHRTLLAGEAGRYLVIISAAFLLANLALGLKIVWPARGRWRAVLKPFGEGNRIRKTFEWHRSIGVWALPMGVLTITTGLCLSFQPTLEKWSGSRPGAVPVCQRTLADRDIRSARAVDSARTLFADASIVSVTLPRQGSACYVVQLRQPAEQRRVFGTTMVLVEAGSFRPVGAWNALDRNLPVKVVVALYTIHTGEWAGQAGRIATILSAALLLVLMILGFLLWLRRRPGVPRAPRRA